MNGFIWNVTKCIPLGSQIIVTPDGMLVVRGPDDAPIYAAKFDPEPDRLNAANKRLRAELAEAMEDRVRLAPRMWHRNGMWLMIDEPGIYDLDDEVETTDENGRPHIVKVKSLSDEQP